MHWYSGWWQAAWLLKFLWETILPGQESGVGPIPVLPRPIKARSHRQPVNFLANCPQIEAWNHSYSIPRPDTRHPLQPNENQPENHPASRESHPTPNNSRIQWMRSGRTNYPGKAPWPDEWCPLGSRARQSVKVPPVSTKKDQLGKDSLIDQGIHLPSSRARANNPLGRFTCRAPSTTACWYFGVAHHTDNCRTNRPSI